MLGTLPISLFIFQTYSANNIVSLNDNFIEGETFEVILKRNSLGLGLSITGKPKQNKQLFVYKITDLMSWLLLLLAILTVNLS